MPGWVRRQDSCRFKIDQRVSGRFGDSDWNNRKEQNISPKTMINPIQLIQITMFTGMPPLSFSISVVHHTKINPPNPWDIDSKNTWSNQIPQPMHIQSISTPTHDQFGFFSNSRIHKSVDIFFMSVSGPMTALRISVSFKSKLWPCGIETRRGSWKRLSVEIQKG